MLLARVDGIDVDDEVLYLGVIMHDLGLAPRFQTDARFDVGGRQRGARVAARGGDGRAPRRGGVGHRGAPRVERDRAAQESRDRGRELRASASMCAAPGIDRLPADAVRRVLDAFPRAGFPEAFHRTLVDEVRRNPDAVRLSWMEGMAVRHVDGYRAADFEAGLLDSSGVPLAPRATEPAAPPSYGRSTCDRIRRRVGFGFGSGVAEEPALSGHWVGHAGMWSRFLIALPGPPCHAPRMTPSMTESLGRPTAPVRTLCAWRGECTWRLVVEYLELVTTLLQRARINDPTAGLWEAADLQWWWRRDQHRDPARQTFWLDDDDTPIAAVIFTDWNGRWGCDAISATGRPGRPCATSCGRAPSNRSIDSKVERWRPPPATTTSCCSKHSPTPASSPQAKWRSRRGCRPSTGRTCRRSRRGSRSSVESRRRSGRTT